MVIEKAGAFAIVLEAVDPSLAREITAKLSIPTIGIGASRDCDGQVLVLSDMLGFLPGEKAKFVHQYGHLHEVMVQHIREYCRDVREHRFPEEKHEY
jgi:3-methyl-2-oxobutanoate hydroxymethyltransferase